MKIESAEVTKHAMNSFLATSITFINEISLICEQTNADVREVEQGLRSDTRIGKKAFLSPGSPFSGGTLGRDLNYLDKISRNTFSTFSATFPQEKNFSTRFLPLIPICFAFSG